MGNYIFRNNYLTSPEMKKLIRKEPNGYKYFYCFMRLISYADKEGVVHISDFSVFDSYFSFMIKEVGIDFIDFVNTLSDLNLITQSNDSLQICHFKNIVDIDNDYAEKIREQNRLRAKKYREKSRKKFENL